MKEKQTLLRKASCVAAGKALDFNMKKLIQIPALPRNSAQTSGKSRYLSEPQFPQELQGLQELLWGLNMIPYMKAPRCLMYVGYV